MSSYEIKLMGSHEVYGKQSLIYLVVFALKVVIVHAVVLQTIMKKLFKSITDSVIVYICAHYSVIQCYCSLGKTLYHILA